MYELKMTTQNIKKELQKDMENLRQNNQTGILEIKSPFIHTKNTVEGHSNRIEKVEDRILELEGKIDIKEKTEEILVNQLRSCERNMQELSNSIKRANLRILGFEEEEVQIIEISTLLNKIIT
jgi:chromosome segregation ATPase